MLWVKIQNAPLTELLVVFKLLQALSLRFYFIRELPHQRGLAALAL